MPKQKKKTASKWTPMLQGLVREGEAEDRVRAVWLEGADPADCWSPVSGSYDIHLAVSDPEFDSFLAEPLSFLQKVAGVRWYGVEDAPPHAKVCIAALSEDRGIHLTVERISLLAKRTRRAVVPLLDKTGQLRFVLTYDSAHPMGR